MKKSKSFLSAFLMVLFLLSCSSGSSPSIPSSSSSNENNDNNQNEYWLKEIVLESDNVSNVRGCFKLGNYIYFLIGYPDKNKSVLYKVDTTTASVNSTPIKNYLIFEAEKDDLNNLICMAKTNSNYCILIMDLNGELIREIPLDSNREFSPCLTTVDNNKIIYSEKGNRYKSCKLFCITYKGHKLWEKQVTQEDICGEDCYYPTNTLFASEVFDISKDMDNNIVLIYHVFWNYPNPLDGKDEGSSVSLIDKYGNNIWSTLFIERPSDEVDPYYHYFAFYTHQNTFMTLLTSCNIFSTSPCTEMPEIREYQENTSHSGPYHIYTLCPIPEIGNETMVELHTMRESSTSDKIVCKIRQWDYYGHIKWVRTLKEFDKYQNLKDFRTINSLLIKDVYQNIEYFFVIKTDTSKLIIVKCNNEGKIVEIK